MSKLETLVPPVELCKLIPDGEFEDAAHAWHLTDVVGFVCRTSGCEQVSGQQWQLIRSNASRIIRARKRGDQIYPAPTLQEIIENGDPVYELTVKHKPGANQNMAENALKAWMKKKGIEDGE